MAKRKTIVEFLNQELLSPSVQDASLNGLQFEGRDEVEIVAVAVDSGRSVIERARDEGAGMLLVHHGLIWEKPIALTGAALKTFSTLYEAKLNLYASHLPLDMHEEWGNNFVLARFLSLEKLRSAVPYRNVHIGCVGLNLSGKTRQEFALLLSTLPGGKDVQTQLPFGPEIPKKVCIVTGSGADALYCAESEDFDTLITGEPKQFAYHYAKERGLNVIFAGHYASETVGVRALGRELEKQFGIRSIFIDEPTGI